MSDFVWPLGEGYTHEVALESSPDKALCAVCGDEIPEGPCEIVSTGLIRSTDVDWDKRFMVEFRPAHAVCVKGSGSL